jgi:hypothetical protein
VVPALRPVTTLLTVCAAGGVGVGEDTVWNDVPGQLGVAVPI